MAGRETGEKDGNVAETAVKVDCVGESHLKDKVEGQDLQGGGDAKCNTPGTQDYSLSGEPKTAPSSASAFPAEPLQGIHRVAIFLAVAVPDAACVACFSAVGLGLKVYNETASDKFNFYGNICGFSFCVWLCFLFVLDAPRRHAIVQVVLGLASLGLLLAGGILKGMRYPWAATLMLLFFTLVLLGFFRGSRRACRHVNRAQFYIWCGMVFTFTGVVVLFVFLSWVVISDNPWNQETRDELIWNSRRIYENVYEERPLHPGEDCGDTGDFEGSNSTSIQEACVRAKTIWSFLWGAPMVVVLSHVVESCFCFRMFFINSGEHVLHTSAAQRLITEFLLTTTFMLAGMYCSMYAFGSSVSLGSALMAFFATGITAATIWIYLEVDRDMIRQSKINSWIVKVRTSDFGRAIAVGSVHIMVPTFLVLDMARQKVRRCTDPKSTPKGLFTSSGQRIWDELATWEWSKILAWVCALGELGFTLLVGSKATFIFFSYLNYQVLPDTLWLVVVLVAIVGFVMFMLPPVPGSAVYLFAGIVIGAKSLRPENASVGFGGCAVIAIIVGSCAKLCACCGQYGIGSLLGRSVKVQQLIGVDKVFTRALEQILKQPGLHVGKVAILVGGPDWPTSVSCGILRMNIPQMLFGTLPVIIVSIVPQTLVGALLNKETVGIVSLVSNGLTGGAAVAQAAAMLLAMYHITRTMERDGERLALPRPEHKRVEELTKQEAAYVQAREEVSQWTSLGLVQKCTLAGATFLIMLSGFVMLSDFMLAEKFCFRRFSIRDKITDSYELGGLNKKALNVIIHPMGYVVLVWFGLGVLLHWIFTKYADYLARAHLRKPVPDDAKSTVKVSDGQSDAN